MRRTSVSLPTRNGDPHEKPARYNSNKDLSVHRAGILDSLKAAWMTQSQRSRYVKTGGILLFIAFLFYFLAPTGTNIHIVGMFTVLSRARVLFYLAVWC
jgi:guanosine-diphosphatase